MMKDNLIYNSVCKELRELLKAEIEVTDQELGELKNDSFLMAHPLYIDSVDFIQLLTSIERKYSWKAPRNFEQSTMTIKKLATSIVERKEILSLNRENEIYIAADGKIHNHEEMLKIALITAEHSITLNNPIIERTIYVSDKNPVQLLLCVITILLKNKTPILTSSLDSKAYNWDTLSQFGEVDSEVIPKTSLQLKSMLEEDLVECIIGFETSGSTGKPKVVFKTLKTMLHEAGSLSNTLTLKKFDIVESYVSPVHMYGFIWSFLIPLIMNISTEFYSPSIKSRTDTKLRKKAINVVVPSVWSLMGTNRISSDSLTITSGSPFGEKYERKFLLEYAEKSKRPLFYEILGSTETGAIGFRKVGHDLRSHFKLFDEVQIKKGAGNERLLYSDFASKAKSHIRWMIILKFSRIIGFIIWDE